MFCKKNLIIKLLINHFLLPNLKIKTNKIINLKIKFNGEEELFKSFRLYFSEIGNDSQKIIAFLNSFDTFEIKKGEDINNLTREAMYQENFLKRYKKELELIQLKKNKMKESKKRENNTQNNSFNPLNSILNNNESIII